MNVSESKAGSFDDTCLMNEMVWKQEYQEEKIDFATTAVILNMLSFPVTILMNVLVIMAVKTRRRLQSKYNILLAFLAGTDLLVGAASQPINIVGQIYVMRGISLSEYCGYHKLTHLLAFSPIFASLLHLTLISIERFVAMRYTFRYMTIFTVLHLKIAVISSWVLAFCPAILRTLSEKLQSISSVSALMILFVNTFFDNFPSFIGLLCNPSPRETNQTWTGFTTSCCRLRKGEENFENYKDNYNGFACMSFSPFYLMVWRKPCYGV